jgi:transcriptional regulator with XRE-family HTH domain
VKHLAKNLKFLRLQKNLKQLDLRAVIGFKPTTWNNYESGVSKPGLDDLIKISKYFGYSETDILHTDLAKASVSVRQGYRQREEEGGNQHVLNEEHVEYKELCKLKDKIIEDNERIKAAQQRQITALKSMVNQLEKKFQKSNRIKK